MCICAAIFSDGLLAQIFSQEVFSLLLGKELVSQALVEKIIFHDLLFERGEWFGSFSSHSAPRTASGPHPRALQPSLTSFEVVIYNSPR